MRWFYSRMINFKNNMVRIFLFRITWNGKITLMIKINLWEIVIFGSALGLFGVIVGII